MGKLGEPSELTTASMWYGTRGTTGTLRCCLRPKLNFNSISFSALLVLVVLLFVLDLAQCRKVCYNSQRRREGGSIEMQLQLRSLEEVCHSYSSRHWSRFDFGSFLSMSPWMKLNAASQQAPRPAPHSTSTPHNLNFRPDPSLKRGGTDVRLLQLWLSPTATAAGLAAACFWSWLLASCSSNSNNSSSTGWACGCRRTNFGQAMWAWPTPTRSGRTGRGVGARQRTLLNLWLAGGSDSSSSSSSLVTMYIATKICGLLKLSCIIFWESAEFSSLFILKYANKSNRKANQFASHWFLKVPHKLSTRDKELA